jgi:hypothetical protein
MVSLSMAWLDEGYVASSGSSTTPMYFTDPIFFTKVSQAQPLIFYNPYITGTNYFPYAAVQSDFRNVSLAAMQWQPFSKNWTTTMTFAQTQSSVRVYRNGVWSAV